jgi:hypothetical protein
VGLATLDPVLYQELASELRERHLPTLSLLPDERIPAEVAVVLMSPQEAERIPHPKVVPVTPDTDRASLWALVEQALHPGDPNSDVVLGLDPGPRPGYAVLSGDRCLAEGNLESPEAAQTLANHVRRRFHARRLRIRVGNGDRLSRDRILTALAPLHTMVEVVDEQGTTPRGRRRPRDAIAARAIARGSGRPAAGSLPAPSTITDGDITNVQHLSRLESGGRFTIPRSEAHRVLRGELTLSDAIVQGQRRYTLEPSKGGPSRRSSERS